MGEPLQKLDRPLTQVHSEFVRLDAAGGPTKPQNWYACACVGTAWRMSARSVCNKSIQELRKIMHSR